MMKRRLLALLLALTMTVALTACGGKETPEGDNDSSVEEQLPEQENPDGQETSDQEEGEEDQTPGDSQETAQPEEEKPETETPAQKPADPKPQQPAQKPQAPAQKPAEKPQAPAQKPAEPATKPENKPASVDLAAFVDSLSKSDAWPALMKAESEVLDSYYPGLSEIATNQCEVHTAMISAAVGEIALVEVQNAADVQKVKDIFQARVNYQVGDETNPGGAWYPDTIEGWKNGNRIVSNGNYVMLVALNEGADSVVTSFNALFA